MVPPLTFSMHHSIKDGKADRKLRISAVLSATGGKLSREQDYKPYNEPATDSSHGSMVLRCCSGGVCVCSSNSPQW